MNTNKKKDELNGRAVALLATNGYEHSELNAPMEALKEAGARVDVISLEKKPIKGWSKGEWHGSTEVDRTVGEVFADQYDALVLPGGVINPDTLRKDRKAVDLVRSFVEAGKPVAAICHAGWLLAEADVVRGRTVTSYASISTDMRNAGANWVDQEVVVDGGIITSRDPNDLPAFNERLIQAVNSAPATADTRMHQHTH